jgi:hypothetical protein
MFLSIENCSSSFGLIVAAHRVRWRFTGGYRPHGVKSAAAIPQKLTILESSTPQQVLLHLLDLPRQTQPTEVAQRKCISVAVNHAISNC